MGFPAGSRKEICKEAAGKDTEKSKAKNKVINKEKMSTAKEEKQMTKAYAE